MIIAVGLPALACEGSTSLRGIRLGRYAESETRKVLEHFLDAAARRDSTALVAIAGDRVLDRVLRDHKEGYLSREYAGAAATSRVQDVSVVLCGADVKFAYVVNGQARNGRLSARFLDDRWQVTDFHLMVEY